MFCYEYCDKLTSEKVYFVVNVTKESTKKLSQEVYFDYEVRVLAFVSLFLCQTVLLVLFQVPWEEVYFVTSVTKESAEML